MVKSCICITSVLCHEVCCDRREQSWNLSAKYFFFFFYLFFLFLFFVLYIMFINYILSNYVLSFIILFFLLFFASFFSSFFFCSNNIMPIDRPCLCLINFGSMRKYLWKRIYLMLLFVCFCLGYNAEERIFDYDN